MKEKIKGKTVQRISSCQTVVSPFISVAPMGIVGRVSCCMKTPSFCDFCGENKERDILKVRLIEEKFMKRMWEWN